MELRRPLETDPSADVVDAVIDGYVAWREQSAAVSLAYADWNRAASSARRPAYDAYLRALAREERAAAAYRDLVEELRVAAGGSSSGAAS